ncbi:MAG: DUF1330 domain-containing protein [Novosphingobium sp.]|jgi:uncharacterized protein (DUF1330 family)|nr:DUF1330 domain-containing protein [Novosphingobium sp.]
MPIHRREDQTAALLESNNGGPIRMVNLQKFREFADYGDGEDKTISGREAYGRYGAEVVKLINKVGGRVVFSGEFRMLVIGDGELEWDMISIAEYPSVATFLSMTSSEEYKKIHVHRAAGLAHQLLLQC